LAAGDATSGRLDGAELHLLHRLAVLGVEGAVLGASGENGHHIRAALDGLPRRLRDPGGAFVTLKRGGRLRGCFGYIFPEKPLYQAVFENGVNAAVNDTRFEPLAADELSDLEVEVSILSAPQRIASHEAFRVGEEGVVLHKDGHRAVFLPEVATQAGWTREETLTYLALKAGLPADAWRNGATLEVFRTTKYGAPYAVQASSGR
jgi:AmmeMemoRadiSam system protein A